MNRRIQNLHAVVLFEFGGDATEHFHGGDFIRFFHLHQLLPPGFATDAAVGGPGAGA